MKKEIKVEGLVLKKKRGKGKDLFVYIFTKEQGKILVVAKGVKKITSRRLSHLDTGNLIRAVVSEKDSFFYLKETHLISGFSIIKEDYFKTQTFFKILKLLDKVLPEMQPESEVFNLTLRAISNLANNSFDFNAFEKKLSQILGFPENELSEII